MNENPTEGAIIEKSHLQNDDILIIEYAEVSMSSIAQCMSEDLKITNNTTVFDEAALYDRFNIPANVSYVSDIYNHECDGNMMAART